MLTKVNLEEAVGVVLPRDITKVIPDVLKGPATILDVILPRVLVATQFRF